MRQRYHLYIQSAEYPHEEIERHALLTEDEAKQVERDLEAEEALMNISVSTCPDDIDYDGPESIVADALHELGGYEDDGGETG